jgi:hypothetical protein
MSFDRDIIKISNSESSEAAKWLEILGNSPLKSTIERALFLPPTFGNLPLDRQVGILKEKAKSKFGVEKFDSFQDPAVRNKLRTSFLLASQISQNSSFSGSSTALTILQGSATLRY